MIVIVDYGLGNLRAVLHKIKKVGGVAKISSKIEDIENADKIILLGVGSFAEGMKNLKQLGLLPVLTKKAMEEKVPILGICLGMQLFTKWSEEGEIEGLGWINAKTKRFRVERTNLKVPHMGWNSIIIKKDNPLLRGIQDKAWFYFVHSYHLDCEDEAIISATTHYGYEFPSIIMSNNLFGVQFHPEKSHKDGLTLLRNFVEIKC
ncbi:imidazole glycerol phosphate synthase subunit HisH [Candidatus Woesearchaeota archaeon]|nr:MAG: imidazole glycerol phosphate synthase subunit HisH [Candidatus Woesearchaeota archaeon]